MATKRAKPSKQEVVVQIPDTWGLNKTQLATLQSKFQNQLVSTMGEKSAALIRIVIVRIRVVIV
jgi:hypothetical protein